MASKSNVLEFMSAFLQEQAAIAVAAAAMEEEAGEEYVKILGDMHEQGYTWSP